MRLYYDDFRCPGVAGSSRGAGCGRWLEPGRRMRGLCPSCALAQDRIDEPDARRRVRARLDPGPLYRVDDMGQPI